MRLYNEWVLKFQKPDWLFSFIDYTKSVKSTYFKINVTKSKDEQVDLFNKQLITFTKAINQVSNSVKKSSSDLKPILLSPNFKH